MHLDGQLGNMRTGGELVYFIDFGLATSSRFDLSAEERDFVESIDTLDADYAAMGSFTGWPPPSAVCLIRQAEIPTKAPSLIGGSE